MTANPIVIVTGANSGVGFGICQRLLEQLATKGSPDAHASWITSPPGSSEQPVCDGLTLIMACRSLKRAEAAKIKLEQSFRRFVQECKKLEGYDGHAERFAANVMIDIIYLDLALVKSVFQFAETVSQRYPYVSHLICNAGVAGMIGIDWPVAFKQILTSPLAAFTAPEYNLQVAGEISVDGLGWVWQCNVFGHFVLFRSLQPILKRSPPSLGGRVIWMSSIESSPKFYDSDDWQLKKTNHPYEPSKYQIDLIGTHLDRLALSESSPPLVRHIVVHPGIASTNISQAAIIWILDYVKVLAFYLARLLGSQNHTISLSNSAISAVHLSLLPFLLIPSFFATEKKSQHTNGYANGHTNSHANGHTDPPTLNSSSPVRYPSLATFRGDAYVGKTEVQDWKKYESEGVDLLNKCEQLYQKFLKEGNDPPSIETASERM
jgi:3-keto steroid reductase